MGQKSIADYQPAYFQQGKARQSKIHLIPYRLGSMSIRETMVRTRY
jgi:hypothetical protein